MSLLMPNGAVNEHGLRYRTDYDLPNEDQLYRMLGKVKLKLFMYCKNNVGFLGRLLCTVEFVWDTTIDTACTDGNSIKWNPYFFLAADEGDKVFILYHELWHIALLHCEEIKAVNPSIANIAMDYVINYMGYKDGVCDRNCYLKSLEFSCLSEPAYDDWGWKAIYLDLMNKYPQMKLPPKLTKPGNQDVKDAPAGSLAKTIGNLVQAYQVAKMSNKAGQLPGEFEEMIQRFLNPVLPWESLFQNFFTERANDDYSYKRPNRRYSSSDIIMPSLVSDDRLQHIVWFFDTSGSISDEMLLRSSSELAYVKMQFNPEKITLVQFDTQIQLVTEFEADTDMTEIRVKGRGGTNLEPVQRWIKENQPDVAVILTDLYCKPMRRDPGIPVLWCVHNNPKATVPFGTLIHLPKE